MMPYNKKKQEEFICKIRNHTEAKATWFQINQQKQGAIFAKQREKNVLSNRKKQKEQDEHTYQITKINEHFKPTKKMKPKERVCQIGELYFQTKRIEKNLILPNSVWGTSQQQQGHNRCCGRMRRIRYVPCFLH